MIVIIGDIFTMVGIATCGYAAYRLLWLWLDR